MDERHFKEEYRRIEKNPLYQEYFGKASVGDPFLLAPKDTLGLKMTIQLHLLNPFTPSIWFTADGGFHADRDLDWQIARLLNYSTTYLLETKIAKILANPFKIPEHTIEESVMPLDNIFIAYEIPHTYRIAKATPPLDVHWLASLILKRPEHSMLIMSFLYDNDKDKLMCISHQMKWGRTYPFGDSTFLGGLHFYDFIVKFFTFINTTIVDSIPTKIPRTTRRRMQRAGLPKVQHEENISVITLRRKIDFKKRPEEEEEGKDWQHHWIVSGHFRLQWYPSLKTHKIIYINPYIKGDLNKPFLEHIYDVKR